ADPQDAVAIADVERVGQGRMQRVAGIPPPDMRPARTGKRERVVAAETEIVVGIAGAWCIWVANQRGGVLPASDQLRLHGVWRHLRGRCSLAPRIEGLHVLPELADNEKRAVAAEVVRGGGKRRENVAGVVSRGDGRAWCHVTAVVAIAEDEFAGLHLVVRRLEDRGGVPGIAGCEMPST